MKEIITSESYQFLHFYNQATSYKIKQKFLSLILIIKTEIANFER